MKPSIPVLRRPRSGLGNKAEKATLLGSQFDSKQCREQFVPSLSCFPQSRCNYLVFWTSVLLRLLLDLDTYVAGCCPFIESSSPTVSRAWWLMVLRLSESLSFQVCHMEECWVLFCLSWMPAKCLSWLRTDYMPMQMTRNYWQLSAKKLTDLLLLPPLTGTWLWFRSGAITGAWYWILTKLFFSH